MESSPGRQGRKACKMFLHQEGASKGECIGAGLEAQQLIDESGPRAWGMAGSWTMRHMLEGCRFCNSDVCELMDTHEWKEQCYSKTPW